PGGIQLRHRRLQPSLGRCQGVMTLLQDSLRLAARRDIPEREDPSLQLPTGHAQRSAADFKDSPGWGFQIEHRARAAFFRRGVEELLDLLGSGPALAQLVADLLLGPLQHFVSTHTEEGFQASIEQEAEMA